MFVQCLSLPRRARGSKPCLGLMGLRPGRSTCSRCSNSSRIPDICRCKARTSRTASRMMPRVASQLAGPHPRHQRRSQMAGATYCPWWSTWDLEDWPRHKSTVEGTEHELGVWLHTQHSPTASTASCGQGLSPSVCSSRILPDPWTVMTSPKAWDHAVQVDFIDVAVGYRGHGYGSYAMD